MHSRSFHVTVYHNGKQREFDPEREHGLTYPVENGRMPTDIWADSLLVAQRRQPEAIYGLHYQPHRCEPIREPLRSAGSADLKKSGVIVY